MTLPIQVAYFANAYDAISTFEKTRVHDWASFTADLAQRLTATANRKEALEMFVPAAWKGTQRNKASVACLTLGVLDVDGGTAEDADRLWERLQRYQACVYQSPRDNPEGVRKLRVIVTLDSPIMPEDAGRFRRALAADLGVTFDPSTTDESRGFFVGALTGTAPRSLWTTNGTEPANVKALLLTAPATPKATAGSYDDLLEGEASILLGDVAEEAQEACAEYLAATLPAGQKNAAVYALGGLLRQWGWSMHDGVETIRAALETRSTTHNDVDDIEAGVSTFARGYAVPNVHGFHAVKELFGEYTADQMAQVFPSSRKVTAELLANVAPGEMFGEPLEGEDAVDAAIAKATEAAAEAGEEVDPINQGFLFAPPASGEPFRPLIAGLEFAEGLGVAILGKYGRAKSPTAIEMGLCLSNGVPWADKPTVKSTVFYLAAEKTYDLREKRDRIARSLGLESMSMHMISLDQPLNDPTLRGRLTRLVAAHRAKHKQPVVVFVDTYSASVEGVDHNSSLYAQPLKELLKELTEQGACVIPLLHARKGSAADKTKPPTMDDAEGFGGIIGALSGTMGLYSSEDDKTLITYCCVRPVRRGFNEFRRRWEDQASPNGQDPEWGLRSIDVPRAEGGTDDGKASAALTFDDADKTVKATCVLLHKMADTYGNASRYQPRNLDGIAAMIAPNSNLTAKRIIATLKTFRCDTPDDTADRFAFPFWGRGENLGLRPTAAQGSVFDARGAGQSEPMVRTTTTTTPPHAASPITPARYPSP